MPKWSLTNLLQCISARMDSPLKNRKYIKETWRFWTNIWTEITVWFIPSANLMNIFGVTWIHALTGQVMPLTAPQLPSKDWYLPEEVVITIRNGLANAMWTIPMKATTTPSSATQKFCWTMQKPYSNGMELSLTRIWIYLSTWFVAASTPKCLN